MSKSDVMTYMRFLGMLGHPVPSAGGGFCANRQNSTRTPDSTLTQYRIPDIVAAPDGVSIGKLPIAQMAYCVVRAADRTICGLPEPKLIGIDITHSGSSVKIENPYHLYDRRKRFPAERIRPDP